MTPAELQLLCAHEVGGHASCQHILSEQDNSIQVIERAEDSWRCHESWDTIETLKQDHNMFLFKTFCGLFSGVAGEMLVIHPEQDIKTLAHNIADNWNQNTLSGRFGSHDIELAWDLVKTQDPPGEMLKESVLVAALSAIQFRNRLRTYQQLEEIGGQIEALKPGDKLYVEFSEKDFSVFSGQ